MYEFYMSAMLDNEDQQAARAKEQLNTRARVLQFQHQVLCPKCGKLCREATAEFFRRGFVWSFHELFATRDSNRAWIGIAIIFDFMGVLFVLVGSQALSETYGVPFMAWAIPGVIALILGSICLAILVKRWINGRRERAMEKVVASSDAELERRVLSICKRQGGFLPDPKNADLWAGLLLKSFKKDRTMLSGGPAADA